MTAPVLPDKKALRAQYIALRKGLSAAEREEKSARAAERIAGLPEYRNASAVLVYDAMPGELDLRPLLRHPASAGKRFAFPVCVRPTEMKAMVPGRWRRGAFGILEPDPDGSEELPPERLDLVICPGVAFDEYRTRLGMGGGYYDRFLPACKNAPAVMAAFEVQHAAFLPREASDVPMSRIVTEDAVY